MRRFFIDKKQAGKAEQSGMIVIKGSDVNHIVNVLRMRPGDRILFSATDGREFEAEITTSGQDEVCAEVRNVNLNTTEPAVGTVLIQGVPKGDKMDLIIQKSVELGVCGILPVITEHTVVKLSPEDALRKKTRWQRIAEEAAKQCGRGIIPEVFEPAAFKKAVSQRPAGELKILAYENEENYTLKKVLEKAGDSYRGSISVLIGPEGGFSPEEAEFASGCGFESVSLGKRILRTETAGIAALAGIRCFFED